RPVKASPARARRQSAGADRTGGRRARGLRAAAGGSDRVVGWLVDAALGLVAVPAAGALRLTGRHRARARPAADRGVAAVEQLVVRDGVGEDVLPGVVSRPARERVHLHQRAAVLVLVQLEDADVGAGRGLIPAQAGDPAVELGERALVGL